MSKLSNTGMSFWSSDSIANFLISSFSRSARLLKFSKSAAFRKSWSYKSSALAARRLSWSSSSAVSGADESASTEGVAEGPDSLDESVGGDGSSNGEAAAAGSGSAWTGTIFFVCDFIIQILRVPENIQKQANGQQCVSKFSKSRLFARSYPDIRPLRSFGFELSFGFRFRASQLLKPTKNGKQDCFAPARSVSDAVSLGREKL